MMSGSLEVMSWSNSVRGADLETESSTLGQDKRCRLMSFPYQVENLENELNRAIS